MSVKYLDPYKDDPYGKLRGSKTETFFKINFDEAILHPIENGYILAGFITGYSGVVRNYKASEALVPGLCAVPIYNGEYEIREKQDDGQYKGVKYQPSIFEKVLCTYIDSNKNVFLPEGKGIGGELSFAPDAMCSSLQGEAIVTFIQQNSKIETVALTDKLPAYSPPKPYTGKGGGSYSRGASSDEKIAFLKKQMISDIVDTAFKEEHTLGSIVKQIISENPTNEEFREIYFEMLIAAIR